MALGIIGIILGMVLFLILVYKGWSSYWVAPICVVVIAAFNQLSPDAMFANQYVQGICDMVLTIFPIIFLGVILGKAMSDTGAAQSIANILVKLFIAKRTGKSKVWMAVLCIVLFGCIFTYCGISGYILTFTMFPIVMIIAEQVNIPRRFVPALLCANCGIMAAPGAPQVNNIVMSNILQQSPTAGFVPGIIAVVFIEACVFFITGAFILRAQKKGEAFDYGGIARFEVEERKLPNPILALLPLLLVFVLYTIIGLSISIALTSGILLCLITMGYYIQPARQAVPGADGTVALGGGKKSFFDLKVFATMNNAVQAYPGALLSVCTPAGIAAVVSATAAFGFVVGQMSGMQVHPLVFVILFTCVVVALTSSPPAALAIVVPVAAGMFIWSGANAISGAALGRVAALATTTFETLPFNGLILLVNGLARTKQKDSYPLIFLNTVVVTLVGTIIAAVLFALFPTLG